MIDIPELPSTLSEPKLCRLVDEFKSCMGYSDKTLIKHIAKVNFLVKSITKEIKARKNTYKLVKKLIAGSGGDGGFGRVSAH